jgi:putative intracellular protease/amidase
MAAPKVLIPMSDYGHDPTETSIPYKAFKNAGFEVHFATENGKIPECDKKMLRGVTQKLLVGTFFTPILGIIADHVNHI